jgi:hypothetical protein
LGDAIFRGENTFLSYITFIRAFDVFKVAVLFTFFIVIFSIFSYIFYGFFNFLLWDEELFTLLFPMLPLSFLRLFEVSPEVKSFFVLFYAIFSVV